jgi:hypothetical protein
MNSIFTEISTDYVDENGVTYMDGYASNDPNEEGRTIAYMINGSAYWTDSELRFDPLVRDTLAKLLAENK